MDAKKSPPKGSPTSGLPIGSSEHYPASVSAEQAVLAAVLIEPGLWPILAARLRPRDFQYEQHRILFRVLRDLAEGGSPVDQLTVRAKLEDMGRLEEVGGIGYLACLDANLPDLGRTDTYVGIVKDRSLLRCLEQLGADLVHRIADGGVTAEALLGRLEGDFLRLCADSRETRLASLKEVVEEAVEELEERPADSLPELSTGLLDLDARTHGLARGNLILIAGRPGTGKTSLALEMARDLALRQARTVAFFSLEMSARELALRILSAESEVPLKSLRKGHLSRRQWQAVHEEGVRLAEAGLYLEDRFSLSLFDLSSAARRHKMVYGLDAVVVDYLQLMRMDRPYATEAEALGSLSRGLKLLARELDVPVIALCQLSRASERRGTGSRPRLSDLRGSGRFEEDADLVIFPYSEIQTKTEESVLIIAKQRNGEVADVPVTFEPELVRFRSRFLSASGPETLCPTS